MPISTRQHAINGKYSFFFLYKYVLVWDEKLLSVTHVHYIYKELTRFLNKNTKKSAQGGYFFFFEYNFMNRSTKKKKLFIFYCNNFTKEQLLDIFYLIDEVISLMVVVVGFFFSQRQIKIFIVFRLNLRIIKKK